MAVFPVKALSTEALFRVVVPPATVITPLPKAAA